MNYVLSSAEIRERCKSTGGTMGVVSALLAGLSIVPPLNALTVVGLNSDIDAWAGSSWLKALLYLSVFPFVCNMVDWAVLYIFMSLVFGCSILLVVGEVLVVVGYTCRSGHVWVLISTAALFFSLLLVMTLRMLMYIQVRCANLSLRNEYGTNCVERFKQR